MVFTYNALSDNLISVFMVYTYNTLADILIYALAGNSLLSGNYLSQPSIRQKAAWIPMCYYSSEQAQNWVFDTKLTC